MKNEFLESVMSLDIIGEYGYSAGYRDIPNVFDTLQNGFNIDEFDKVIQDNLPVIPGVDISYQKADNLITLSATKGNHQYALEVCLKQGVINFIGRESMEYDESGKLHEVNANRKWGLAPYWINRVQDSLYLTTAKEGNREVKYHQSVGVITVPVLNMGSDEEPYIKLMVIAEVTQDHAARGTGGEYGCNASARWRIPFNEESITYINQLMDKVDDALFNDDCTVNVNGLRELMTELKGLC